jgi:hypothetical protein
MSEKSKINLERSGVGERYHMSRKTNIRIPSDFSSEMRRN